MNKEPNKTYLTVDNLRDLLLTARELDTVREWCNLVLAWADSAVLLAEGLIKERDDLQRDLKGIDSVLRFRGVPETRAESARHALDVLLTRLDREISVLRSAGVRLDEENERLREQCSLARMCVTCGRIADVPRDHLFPECCTEEYTPCSFDLTPQEALQHWRQAAHDEAARAAKLEEQCGAVHDMFEASSDALSKCNLKLEALEAENARLSEGGRRICAENSRLRRAVHEAAAHLRNDLFTKAVPNALVTLDDALNPGDSK